MTDQNILVQRGVAKAPGASQGIEGAMTNTPPRPVLTEYDPNVSRTLEFAVFLIGCNTPVPRQNGHILQMKISNAFYGMKCF